MDSPDRSLNENGRIYAIVPADSRAAVLVVTIAYDQVNKAPPARHGVETEIWGLRKTTLVACPELANTPASFKPVPNAATATS